VYGRRLTKRPQALLAESASRSADAAVRSADAAVRSLRTGSAAVFIALLVGFVGVTGSIYVQHQSAADTSLATLNQHRRDTYERYAADLAQLNEVLWANVYWTGDGPSTSQSAEFSNKGQPISASLGGDEAAIKVISSPLIWDASKESDGSGPEMEVHGAWNDMLLHFKCSSGLQAKEDCPDDLPRLKKAGITTKLMADSKRVDSALTAFLVAARAETDSDRS
jgi:hypothetical protein